MPEPPIIREVQEAEAESSRALTLVRHATSLQVIDRATAAEAAEIARMLRDAIERVEDWFRPLIESVTATRGELLARRRQIVTPLAEAAEQLRARLTQYLETAPKSERPDGVCVRSSVRITITDEQAAIAFLAKNGHYEALSLNTPQLQRMAAAMGGCFRVPGVQVCTSGTVSISRADDKSPRS